MRNRKIKAGTRRGFTLIELLAVIVIIGILTSGILLSSGAATSSARALGIVNDLRGMKEAVLMMYIDRMDYFDKGGDFGELKPKEALASYVDNPEKYDDHYGFTASGGKWYVTYTIKDADPGAEEIKTRLAGRAESAGLLASAKQGDAYKGGNTVYMVAR